LIRLLNQSTIQHINFPVHDPKLSTIFVALVLRYRELFNIQH